MNYLDFPSLTWAALSTYFLTIGIISLNAFAIGVGIFVGISTIALNGVKILNQIRIGRKIKKDKQTEEDEKEIDS
jgi:hypothetical protein